MTRAFSFGGGVQSTAALVLAAQGQIDYRMFLFANVGDDSENPDTLAYIRDHSRPYAAAHGLELVEVRRAGETLLERTRRETRSVKIPMRMANGAPGRRDCTTTYKRAVIRKHLGPGAHTVGLGISWDEIQRMRTDSGYKNITNEYPLIDLRLTRDDCLRIVAGAGLPTPPKSSCWFCPFKRLGDWAKMQRTQPELYRRSVELEALLIEKRKAMGKDPVYLTSRGRPLPLVIGDQLALALDDDSCESGYCMV